MYLTLLVWIYLFLQHRVIKPFLLPDSVADAGIH